MNADSEGSESIWSTYLLPDRSIDKGAQKATGLTTEYFQGKKCLCLHGVPVEALPYKKGIQSFYSYLLQQSSENKHTILLGYGSDRLDVPVLINNFKRHGISCHDLEGIIAGFVDALHLIRKMRGECHPLFVKDGVPLNRSASLGDVYYQLFNTQLTDAHCATADTRGLHRILFQSSLGIKPSQLLDHSSTVSSAYEVADYTSKYLMLLKSMRGRLFNYGDKPRLSITYDDALRIARSGLHYEDLARIYREHGPNGITIVMTSPCDDRPHRVTNNQAIVEAVIQHFQSISGNLVY